MDGFELFVVGIPAPKGSMRAFAVKTRFGIRAVLTNDNARTKPWQAFVTDSVRRITTSKMLGPVRVDAVFFLPRPKYHYKKDLIRDDAPTAHDKKPDIDKLSRCLLDAITDAGAWGDDSQVSGLFVSKEYGEKTGVQINVRKIENRSN